MWKAFAKRGLGVDAVQKGYVNGFNYPVECGGTPLPPTTTTSEGTKATGGPDECVIGGL
jgi:hypothetical protein